MCTKAPATADFESATRGNYLADLEVCLKRFNGALTLTMDSYRDLLTAFDRMGQVYGSLAADLRLEEKDSIVAMRDGMRDLKDKGPFVTFNTDMHEGTLNVLDPLRGRLKAAHKTLAELKSRQKEYDSIRYKIEKKEKEYTKKDKALTTSESYRKDVEKRDKCKLLYEEKRDSFEEEVKFLKDTTGRLVIKSMNNYLHCAATLSGYLETTMNDYRTDLDEDGNPTRAIRLDNVRQEAQRRSVTKRRATTTNTTSSSMHNISMPDTQPRPYPVEATSPPAARSEESALKSPEKSASSTSRLTNPNPPVANGGAAEKPAFPTEHEVPATMKSPPAEKADYPTEVKPDGEGAYPSEAPHNPLVSH